MNKNILLLLAAGGAYYFIRNQQSQPAPSQPATRLDTGASTYLPVAPVPVAPANAPAAGGSFLNNLANGVATTGHLVDSGVSIWKQLSTVFGHNDRAADRAADTAEAGFWAGPTYLTS